MINDIVVKVNVRQQGLKFRESICNIVVEKSTWTHSL